MEGGGELTENIQDIQLQFFKSKSSRNFLAMRSEGPSRNQNGETFLSDFCFDNTWSDLFGRVEWSFVFGS